MRKLYALVTGLLISLVTLKTIAQQNKYIFSASEENSFSTVLNPFTGFDNESSNPLSPVTGFSGKTDVTCGADFEINTTPNSSLYKKFTVVLSNSEQKKPVYICWKFGDGKDTCIQYSTTDPGPFVIVHYYQHPGTYEVCIKILYDGGCEATKCKDVVVEEICRADFEKLTPVPGTSSLYTYFNALPWNSSYKKPVYICWSFGDGKDTCIKYPENYNVSYSVPHKYLVSGSYEVCIRIVYDGGCDAKLCKTIQIGPRDECKADFEKLPVNSVTSPFIVYYKALPWNNINKKPKTICWTFGDGKDTCINYGEDFSGTYAVRHEYHQPGSYEVCIKILYYGGCEAKNCKLIQIARPDECKADFEKIQAASTNNPFVVYYKALLSNSGNRKPALICWKFGDGKDTCINYGEDFTGLYTVEHKYNVPGNYDVCVNITYYGSCEAKNCKTIKIEGRGDCSIKLFELIPSITSLVRGFYASPLSPNNNHPTLVCWYFGDGKDTCVQLDPAVPLTELAIRHTYPAPGVYKACVKILFEGGCITYDCVEVTIRPVTNACGGYFTDSLISPRTFKFKAYSIHSPNNPVAGYHWTFGDGSASNGSEVIHTYNTPGAYDLCLYIKTEHGCETQVCKKLNVPGNAEPVLRLSPNPVVNILHVSFYSTNTEQMNIKIANAFGVIVKNYVVNAVTGTNNWDFDLTSLIAGIYTLYIQSPNQLAGQLFIKN